MHDFTLKSSGTGEYKMLRDALRNAQKRFKDQTGVAVGL
eukprot:SAG11_NODE_5414_length_1566_cov_3.502386_1_plen_39_part_00